MNKIKKLTEQELEGAYTKALTAVKREGETPTPKRKNINQMQKQRVLAR